MSVWNSELQVKHADWMTDDFASELGRASGVTVGPITRGNYRKGIIPFLEHPVRFYEGRIEHHRRMIEKWKKSHHGLRLRYIQSHKKKIRNLKWLIARLREKYPDLR